MRFWCFASIKIPSNPVILNPRRLASAQPRRSSINSKSAFSSKARAIASDSPGSNLTSSRRRSTISRFATMPNFQPRSSLNFRGSRNRRSDIGKFTIYCFWNGDLSVELRQKLQVLNCCQICDCRRIADNNHSLPSSRRFFKSNSKSSTS